MATTVAQPLETQFAQIAGVTQMTSVNVLGQASITCSSTSAATSTARHRTCWRRSTRVRAAAEEPAEPAHLPQGEPGGQPDPDPARVQSDELPLIDVDDYAENILAQQISARSAAWRRCSSAASRSAAVRVQVDPARLAAMG